MENFSPELKRAQTEAFDIQEKAKAEKEQRGEVGELTSEDYEKASQDLSDLKFEQTIQDVIRIGKMREQNLDRKYDNRERVEEAGLQARLIRSWAETKNLKEGQDYRIIEDLEAYIKGINAKYEEHDIKRYAMAIQEDKLFLFRDFFNGKFAETMNQINSKNNARLNYSWGGRFCVCDAGLPCDTVIVSDMERMAVKTHHQEFKEFFKTKTGFEFPSGEKMNEILFEVSVKALPIYKEALEILKQKDTDGVLPDEAYGFKDAVNHTVNLLERALDPDDIAVKELGEFYDSSTEMNTYNDLTYNIDDLKDFSLIREYTGLDLPDNLRIDKIFENYINVGENKKEFKNSDMENICKEFSDQLFAKS